MRPGPAGSLILLVALPALLVSLLSITESRSPAAPGVTGEVRDGNGPVAGATVRFQGGVVSDTTDRQGHFRLPRGGHLSGRLTAWKDGYFIAGSPLDADPLRLLLRAVPQKDNADYQWVDPVPDPAGRHNCANCHQEIYREWNAGGHARSATGRQFRDLYLGTGGGWSLVGQHPLGKGVCAACHAPSIQPGDAALADLGKVQGVAARGVHCDYCHKVSGLKDGTLGLSHGRDVLQLLRPAADQLFFGPLDDVDRGEDVYSPFYRDSKYCAACHEGVVFGVHVYSTYSEWLESPAPGRGQHCQDCHMKPTGRMTNIAPGKGGIERDPWTLGSHRHFAGSRAEMLRQSLNVSAEASRASGGVSVVVRVRAENVGHRVPTGFIDRHLILSVEGLDARGQRLAAREGPRLPALVGARLVGQPGLLFAKLLRGEDGHSPAPFWKADLDPVDTRLKPGRVEKLETRFPPAVRTVRVRLIHRRFWEEIETAKGWPASDLLVFEQLLQVRDP